MRTAAEHYHHQDERKGGELVGTTPEDQATARRGTPPTTPNPHPGRCGARGRAIWEEAPAHPALRWEIDLASKSGEDPASHFSARGAAPWLARVCEPEDQLVSLSKMADLRLLWDAGDIA